MRVGADDAVVVADSSHNVPATGSIADRVRRDARLASESARATHDRADEAAVRLEICISRWSERHPEQAEALNARLREVA
jgi:hypothetical protein